MQAALPATAAGIVRVATALSTSAIGGVSSCKPRCSQRMSNAMICLPARELCAVLVSPQELSLLHVSPVTGSRVVLR